MVNLIFIFIYLFIRGTYIAPPIYASLYIFIIEHIYIYIIYTHVPVTPCSINTSGSEANPLFDSCHQKMSLLEDFFSIPILVTTQNVTVPITLSPSDNGYQHK